MITTDITLVIQVFNMIILMFILNRVLYTPVKAILKERSEKLRGMQDDISKFEKNAQLRQEEVDAKMAQASGRAKAALESARAGAQAAGDEKLAAIKAEAVAAKDEKLAALKADIETAKASLQDGMDDFANEMASKILGRSL